jgi:stromal membrane-associated protein
MYPSIKLGASLDIGVFVCSNCSGSHRALGVPVTRIKSIHLDQWRIEWFDNMQLGNTLLNSFWEANLEAADSR